MSTYAKHIASWISIFFTFLMTIIDLTGTKSYWQAGRFYLLVIHNSGFNFVRTQGEEVQTERNVPLHIDEWKTQPEKSSSNPQREDDWNEVTAVVFSILKRKMEMEMHKINGEWNTIILSYRHAILMIRFSVFEENWWKIFGKKNEKNCNLIAVIKRKSRFI